MWWRQASLTKRKPEPTRTRAYVRSVMLESTSSIRRRDQMYKWKVALAVLGIALFAAWYAFRPERLFVNRRIEEALPAAGADSSSQIIESGTFSGVMHPTAGTAAIYRLGDGSRVLRFTNFMTSNGPDVHVYLVAVDD